jgi:hypothetical protein
VALVVVGSVLVVIGVFLPWVEAGVEAGGSFPGFSVPRQSANGLQFTQGLVNIALAIAQGVLGLLGAGKVIPLRLVAFLIILASIAVILTTGTTITSAGSQTFGFGAASITASSSLQPGIFITAAGGIVLLIGGIVALLSPE